MVAHFVTTKIRASMYTCPTYFCLQASQNKDRALDSRRRHGGLSIRALASYAKSQNVIGIGISSCSKDKMKIF